MRRDTFDIEHCEIGSPFDCRGLKRDHLAGLKSPRVIEDFCSTAAYCLKFPAHLFLYFGQRRFRMPGEQVVVTADSLFTKCTSERLAHTRQHRHVMTFFRS